MHTHAAFSRITFCFAVLFALPSGAIVESKPKPATELLQPATELLLSGWVTGTAELLIYPKHEDIGRRTAGACVSGALAPRAVFPESLRSARVTLYGFWLPWDYILKLRSANVVVDLAENSCGGARIAVIERVEASAPQ